MRYILLVISLISFTACEQESFVQPEPVPITKELMLLGDWKYQSLIINGDTLYYPDVTFEPDIEDGFLYHIQWRWFRYSSDRTYEYRKETGIVTSIGAGKNYQPSFGYWILDESKNVLVHNERESYATSYAIIELNDTVMIREYERVIQESSDSIKWPVGDTVIYREILIPMDHQANP